MDDRDLSLRPDPAHNRLEPATDAPHHPLPATDKARRDELPEFIEEERALGDDAGDRG